MSKSLVGPRSRIDYICLKNQGQGEYQPLCLISGLDNLVPKFGEFEGEGGETGDFRGKGGGMKKVQGWEWGCNPSLICHR